MSARHDNISSSDDIIDVRDIIARVEELREERAELESDDESVAALDEFDRSSEGEELTTLASVLERLAGSGGDHEWGGDWYPITLIRDSYFEDYARELVEECGYISEDLPSWIEIDWEATARNVRMDYSAVEFDGVTYWYR